MTDFADLTPRAYTVAPIWLAVAGGLAASLLNQKNEMALLCLAVLLLAALTWGWSRSVRKGLVFTASADRARVFPGEVLGLALTVQNANFLPAWVQASPPFEDTMDIVEGGERTSLNTALRWRETAHFQWRLKAGKRGVYRLGPSQVHAGDLLGFFPWKTGAQTSRELIVFPKLVPVVPPKLDKRDFFGSPSPNSPVCDPVYLWGTRDYEPGRPARFIHWRASARHQKWQEKIFEPSAQTKVLLVLAASGFVENTDPEGFERAIEVLASLAVLYHRQGLTVNLATDAPQAARARNGEEVPGAQTPLVALLERLARLRFSAGPTLLYDLGKEAGRLRRANVVFFCRQWDQTAEKAGAFFRAQAVPATFLANARQPEDAGSPATGPARLLLLSDVTPKARA